MDFNIIGVLTKDNSVIFSMKTHYVPRQHEELEIDGVIFTVEYVRYKLSAGNFSSQDVFLGLTRGSVK